MQEHAPVQPGCQGCQRFQANSLKTPQFIQTLTAKVAHERPCENCMETYARWFTPPLLPPDALVWETLLTALRAIFSPRNSARGKNPDISCVCRWRAWQMMRSLPMRAVIRCLNGKCGGLKLCLSHQICKFNVSKTV